MVSFADVLINTIKHAMIGQMHHPSPGFEEVVKTHFWLRKDRILQVPGLHALWSYPPPHGPGQVPGLYSPLVLPHSPWPWSGTRAVQPSGPTPLPLALVRYQGCTALWSYPPPPGPGQVPGLYSPLVLPPSPWPWSGTRAAQPSGPTPLPLALVRYQGCTALWSYPPPHGPGQVPGLHALWSYPPPPGPGQVPGLYSPLVLPPSPWPWSGTRAVQPSGPTPLPMALVRYQGCTPSGPTPLPMALVRYRGCTPSGPTPLPMALVTPLALPETPSAPGPIGLLRIV